MGSLGSVSRCVNPVAFATVTALAVGTAASVVAAATVASTVAIVAFSVLAVVGAAISIASITAWIDPRSTDVKNYFSTIAQHSGYAIAGAFQFVAQTLVQALVQGIGQGVSTAVRRRIAGPDLTVGAR